jgi:branched-subunit amino acid transport protein
MSNQIASYGWGLWGIIAGMAVVTYCNRAGLLLLSERFVLPPAWQAALRYAPASALAAIVVPDLLAPDGTLDLSLENARLIAGLVGLGVTVLMRSTFAGIVGGMLALHTMLWLR